MHKWRISALLARVIHKIKVLFYVGGKSSATSNTFLPKGDSYYGKSAEEYERTRERTSFWVNENSIVESFLQDLIMTYPFSDSQNRVLLDVPIGTGRFVNIYQRFGFEFRGIDISEEMLEQAKLKEVGGA